MRFKDESEQAVFDLYQWRTNPAADWFTCHLFSLFCKADIANRNILMKAFPVQYGAWWSWYVIEDEDEFLAELKERFSGVENE